jgi:putative ABC transport system permease protein
MMWKVLDNRKDAELYLSKMKESGIDTGGMDPDYLIRLNEYRKETRALTRADQLTADVGIGWMGLGKRMGWLVFVSMLVCGIGISNAMLMTVTERFREIATMKCLGALDGFIMIVFVLEACFLGFFGGILGGILGDGIGMSRMLAAFGSICLDSFPVVDLALATCFSIVLGITLAAIAAVYPSLKAARLAPMEAMRIE